MPPSTKSSQNICCVKNIYLYSLKYPGHGRKEPLYIALGLDGTILDLRKEMEKVTGTSTEPYPIETSNSLGGLANGVRVFGQDPGCRNDRFLTFLVRNDTGAEMTLCVVDLTNRIHEINCKPADSVDSVMSKIQDILHIPVDEQSIIYAGKKLERGKTNFQRLIMFEVTDCF